MRWPFTPFGTSTLLATAGPLLLAVLALLAWAPGGWWLVPVPLLAFVLAFFRDPERPCPGGEDELLAPADGVVSDVVTVDDPSGGPRCLRLGIFLSVFDVHVNRAPCSGEVERVERREGGFLDARDPRAIEENRAATILLRRPDGRAVAVRQITGLIARRIVCPVHRGERLVRGARYGMIRFGSRTELVVPESEVSAVGVKVGDRVKGGETIVITLRPAGTAGAVQRTAAGRAGQPAAGRGPSP